MEELFRLGLLEKETVLVANPNANANASSNSNTTSNASTDATSNNTGQLNSSSVASVAGVEYVAMR